MSVQAGKGKLQRVSRPETTASERLWVSHVEQVLTLEVALYGLAVAVGLALRFLLLDLRPLSVDEGALAVESYRIWQGQPPEALRQGPLTAHGTALFLAMFAGGDGAARLLSALFGTVLLATPYLLRQVLGRVPALLAAWGFALSPLLLFASRSVGSGIVPATLGVLLWWALEPGIKGVRPRRALVAASLLGALVASGSEGVTVLVALAVAALVSSTRLSALPSALRWASTSAIWHQAAALLVATLLILGTGLGTNLRGVQWVLVDVWANWLGAFNLGAPKESLLVMLALYELPVVLLALPQLSKAILRPARADTFLALWAMLLLLQGMLQGAGPVSRIVLPLVPIYLMAARMASGTLSLARGAGGGWRWNMACVAVAVPVAVALIGLTALANQPAPFPTTGYPYLYGEAALVGVAGLWVLFLLEKGARRALLWYLATVLAVAYLLHGAFFLNYRLETVPREPVVGAQVSPFLRDAAADAVYYSRFYDTRITVDPQWRAATEWYLREARAVQYAADSAQGIGFELVPAGPEGSKPGSERRPGLYAPAVDPRDSTWRGVWRWMVSRDGLIRPNQRDIILRAPAGDW